MSEGKSVRADGQVHDFVAALRVRFLGARQVSFVADRRHDGSGTTAPLWSVTVPLIPPRVCWAEAEGVNAGSIKSANARKRVEGPMVLHTRILPREMVM